MRLVRAAAFVLPAALLGVVGWAAYRAGWLRSLRAPTPSAGNAEPPVAEYREVQSGPDGQTGSLITIDRTGRVTLQTIPLGPGSKTMHAQLSCDWLTDLPRAMKEEFANFRTSYGQEGPVFRGEISIVDRWHGTEKRVVWHNPPSGPRPPEGSWAHVVVYFEDLRRSTEEAAKQPASDSDMVFEYGHRSSGIVGTYITLLSVSKSGSVVLRHGLRYAMPVGHTQLTPDELAKLLQTVEEAKFVDFQQCYGRHAPVNAQDSWMSYHQDGKTKGVTWMSDPADPKPPDGWFRIVDILDRIKARAEKQPYPQPAPRRVLKGGL